MHNSTSFTNGLIGKAIKLTGQGSVGSSGGHVIIPFIDFSSMDSFSISLWVKEHGMSYSHGEAYIWFGDHSNGWIGISHFSSNIEFNAGSNFKTSFDNSFLNKFVLYTLTYDNGVMRSYINSELINSTQAEPKIYGKTSAIGKHWWQGASQSSTRLSATIDDLRIYNRLLSDEEIRTIFNKGDIISGCFELNKLPIQTGTAMLMQSGEMFQKVQLDSNGCYQFYGVIKEKPISVLIRTSDL